MWQRTEKRVKLREKRLRPQDKAQLCLSCALLLTAPQCLSLHLTPPQCLPLHLTPPQCTPYPSHPHNALPYSSHSHNAFPCLYTLTMPSLALYPHNSLLYWMALFVNLTHRRVSHRRHRSWLRKCFHELQPCGAFSASDQAGRAQPTVGGAIPGLVVLVSIRKQAEQAMGSEPIRSTPP